MLQEKNLTTLSIDANQRLEERNYWLEKLAGELAETHFPYDYKTPGENKRRNETVTFTFNGELVSKLMKLSNNSELRLYIILTAGVVGLLYKYTGHKDIIIGSPIDKQDMETEFINTVLVLRNQVKENFTFKELLLQLSQTISEAADNANYPLEALLYQLGIPFSRDEFPLFDIAVMLENIHDKKDIRHIPVNMMMTFSAGKEYVRGELEYNADKYNKTTIRRILSHLENFLCEALGDVNIKPDAINIFSPEEKKQILVGFNDTVTDYPKDKSIPRIFEEQVEKTPDRTALVFCEQHLTYGVLSRRVNQLAGLLRAKGVEPDQIVGLMAERSPEMIVGILGILKAGGAYLPIDLEYPEDRINYMLVDSNAGVLVSGVSELSEVSRGIEVVKLSELSEEHPTHPTHFTHPTHLCCVIYTSGTTGKPKGNLTDHYNVTRVVKNTNYIELTENDRVLQLSNYAFDGSVFDIYGALLNGAALVTLKKDDVFDGNNLVAIIPKENITVFFATTVLFNAIVELKIQCLKNIRKVLFGGERVSLLHSKRAREYLGKDRIIHVYGPTESTVYATYHPIDEIDEKLGTIPIGKPLANTTVYILDENKQPLPIGGTGEIYIGAEGLARGYLNNPGLTAEKYFYRSYRTYRTYSSKKIYKTGDLARWLPDGNIEFLGRVDQQVKIRGFRIEPGEIESLLRGQDEIKEALVIVKDDEVGDKYLCAYITAEEEVDIPELKDRLSDRLPDFMVPSYFVQLEKMPLTPNGKVDRKALPEPGTSGSGAIYAAPRNEIEVKLAGLWSDLLLIETDKIGIDDDFFDLGGHSLKATILVADIHKALNIKIPLAEVFRAPTIRSLAEYIMGAGEEEHISIEPAEKREYYELSSAQKRLYILQQMVPETTPYNITLTVPIDTDVEIDRERLAKTFKRLVERHESLRTSFPMPGKKPVQKIHDEVEFKIEYYDLAAKAVARHPKTKDREDIIKNFIRPFDLSCAPLLRVGLLEIGKEKHILMVDMHHTITDGTSQQVLIREFMILYANINEREECSPLRIQYKDYTLWQNSGKEKERVKKQEGYWLKEFEREIPVLDLPMDYPRPAIQSFEGNILGFRIGEVETQGIKALASGEDATLYMVLLVVFNVFMSKISGNTDIVVGTPTAGRRHADLREIIGMFVNTLALRNYPSAEKTFKDFLGEVKERTLAAFENQEYPFEDLVERLEVDKDLSRNPLFDIMFILQDMEEETSGPGAGQYETPHRTAMFDLTWIAAEVGRELSFAVEYSTKLFKKETMERFIRWFKKIVSIVIEKPGITLLEIEIISEEEKNRVLFEFNRTEAAFPKDKSIHEWFETQAAKMPDSVAAAGTRQLHEISITYGELNRKCNRLAEVLRGKGVLADDIIGIKMNRSIEMVIGILGILKAGGAYMPILPDYPEERIKYMLEDSKAKVLLAAPAAQVKVEVKEESIEIIDISEGFNSSTLTSTCQVGPANLAYVIYTSGSTGKPKGVMIEHSSIINTLLALQEKYPFRESDVYLLKTSYVFDVSVAELFGWFLGGGKLAILEKDGDKDPGKIIETVQRTGVTHINFVPSMFNVFVDFLADNKPGKLSGLRYLFLAGEAIYPEYVNKFRHLGLKCQLENIYGPTEASIYSSWYSLSAWDGVGSVPIGKPLYNVKLYILDKHEHWQPVGVPGELCISGTGLSRGYLNNPELTAGKYSYRSYRSYRSYSSKEIYKTGDLARWLPDGNIEFLGRMDHQVKIRGFRIEPGEIENRLLRHDEIKEAVVIDRADKTGARYLSAYMTSNNKLKIPQLRKYLADQLPDYMIPAFFVQIETIPLTATGKIDRKSLPQQEIKVEEYTPPGNKLEEKLEKIWAEVLLGEDTLHASIGIDANFFRLGGHSLKAAALVSGIHKELNVKVPLQEIFSTPTIRGLSNYIKGLPENKYAYIDAAEEKEYYALSSAQKGLYIIRQMDPGSTVYNIPEIIELAGEYDPEKLESSFTRLIERHENLRTSFPMVGDEPVQKIHHPGDIEFEIEYYDGKLPTITDFIRPFDLTQVPLVRVGLLRLTPGNYVLMIDIHHIISDWVSNDVLRKDFMAFYNGEEPPGLKLRYKDYSEWQHRQMLRGVFKKQENYWLGEFRGDIPLLNLSTDYPRPDLQSFEGSIINFEIGKEEKKALKQTASEEKVTMFMLLLALFTIMLSKLGGQEDIIVGTDVTGRSHADMEHIIGMFANMLPLRNFPTAKKTLKGFLKEVKERTLDAFENQDYQFENLVDSVAVDKDVSRNPIFDVVFSFKEIDAGIGEAPGGNDTGVNPGLHIDEPTYGTASAKFDLVLHVTETPKQLFLAFEYCTKLFKKETIEKFIVYFREIVSFVIKNPGAGIGEIEMVSEEEEKRLLKTMGSDEGNGFIEDSEKSDIRPYTREAEFDF